MSFNPWDHVQNEAKELILQAFKKAEIRIDKNTFKFGLDETPDSKFGDLSTGIAMQLSKELGKAPRDIAQIIADNIDLNKSDFERVEIAGPGYLNFYFNYAKLFENLSKIDANYGVLDINKGKKAMIEFCGVNPNKAHHVGHLRNDLLGSALSLILKSTGYKVINADLVNDKGLPVAQTILAYQMWAKGKTPDCKPDVYVGKLYSMFREKENDELDKKAQDILQKLEAKDEGIVNDWKKIMNWFYEGIAETHKMLGFKIDKYYYESETYKLGKDFIEQGLKTKLFYKEADGVIKANLKAFNLPDKVVLRSDGTSIYATNDIALAHEKILKENLDLSIYIVGAEQKNYFDQIFAILSELTPELAGKSVHVPYGLVNLKSGKMSSREGNVVLADDVIAEIIEKAKKEIISRNKDATNIDKLAKIIGLGALKFGMLKMSAHKSFIFDPELALSFEGETAPYIQYSAVRGKKILAKAKVGTPDYPLLTHESEKELIKEILKFPHILQKTAEAYSPHILAEYLIEVAGKFNAFYRDNPVLKAESDGLRNARLKLVESTVFVLTNGLKMLGIDTPDRM